ncbi:MAG: DUF6263 family protein [Maribacter sp.]|nr:DUF6263 family protein [Maribacter sp.]
MKYLVTTLLFVFFGFPGHGQSVLQYELKKDAVFLVKQTAQQVITQELEGATQILTNKIDGILEFKVLGRIADTYEIALTFKDLNLQMTSNLQGELMNIKAKEVTLGDMQSQIFNSLLETPVKLVLTRTGDILEVIGGDSLVSKMANASGLEDEFSLDLMKKSLQKEFGSQALSNNYKQMTFIYPLKRIKVADTWDNEFLGKLNAKNHWKLETLSPSEAIIHGSADVVMNVTEPGAIMILRGTQESKIITDRASGFIKKMTVEGYATGTSTMPQMGNKEIPTTIKSSITYELINKIHVP